MCSCVLLLPGTDNYSPLIQKIAKTEVIIGLGEIGGLL